MASHRGQTDARSGTGQDTPKGVCPCPVTLPRYANRDTSGQCHASVTLSRSALAEQIVSGRPSLVTSRFACARRTGMGGRMSGRRSRNKGARTERSIVNALQANGIAAVRVPLSGAVGGRFAGDIVLPLMGRDLCVEVKARATGSANSIAGSTSATC